MKLSITLPFLIAAIALIAAEPETPAVANKQQMTQAIRTNDMVKLKTHFTQISTDAKATHKERIQVALTALIAVDGYLKTNSEPTEIPQLNIAPPDGSRAGIDPIHIKEPQIRAAYAAAIEANKKLIERHNNWRAASDIKTSSLKFLQSQRIENASLFSAPEVQVLLNQLTSTNRDAVNAAPTQSDNKALHPTGGAVVPK